LVVFAIRLTYALTVDPLGGLIVAGVRRAAELWGWDGQLIRSLHTRGYKVHQVAVSPDGRHILTLSDAPTGSVVCYAHMGSADVTARPRRRFAVPPN
jgi:hypothetical protein